MGSKLIKCKNQTLVLVLLDFEHAGVRGSVQCMTMRQTVNMQQFELSRTRTVYHTEAHASNFALITF